MLEFSRNKYGGQYFMIPAECQGEIFIPFVFRLVYNIGL